MNYKGGPFVREKLTLAEDNYRIITLVAQTLSLFLPVQACSFNTCRKSPKAPWVSAAEMGGVGPRRCLLTDAVSILFWVI